MVYDKPEPIDKYTALVLGIGKAKRISIPITENLPLYQQLADDLRAMATEIDVAVRGVAGHQAPDAKVALPRISFAVDNFNNKKRMLLKHFGLEIRDGRPPTSQWVENSEVEEEQARNRMETEKQLETENTPLLVFKKR